MIYLQLFLNFLMIGALSFGGGYGMISLVRGDRAASWLADRSGIPEFCRRFRVHAGPAGNQYGNLYRVITGRLSGSADRYDGCGAALVLHHPADRGGVEKPDEVCGCGSLSFRCEALCGGHDPGDRAEHDALHTGRHQDTGGWICTGCEIDPCVRCFMGGAFCLEEADAKSPVAHRNDPAGGGTGNPVLGRMRDHRPFFVAQCSTNSPRRANMWSMGPEPLPRSSMADRQPEIYALARSTAASRG